MRMLSDTRRIKHRASTQCKRCCFRKTSILSKSESPIKARALRKWNTQCRQAYWTSAGTCDSTSSSSTLESNTPRRSSPHMSLLRSSVMSCRQRVASSRCVFSSSIQKGFGPFFSPLTRKSRNDRCRSLTGDLADCGMFRTEWSMRNWPSTVPWLTRRIRDRLLVERGFARMTMEPTIVRNCWRALSLIFELNPAIKRFSTGRYVSCLVQLLGPLDLGSAAPLVVAGRDSRIENRREIDRL